MDQCVLDLLKRSAVIPSMPQVATRFLELVQDPEFDYQEVATVLSTDAGTASEILRLANSSLFGLTRQITSLPHALTLLGLKRVRSLVLGRYIVDSLDRREQLTIERSYFWRRSLATAVLAAKLAEHRTPKLREEAFISGLLADVGVVVLDEALTDRYRPIAREYRPQGRTDLASAELAMMGITHGQASALVLDYWQIPEIVCDTVRDHPWEATGDQTETLSRIVGAADRIGKYLCEKPKHIDATVDDCRRMLADLKLEPAVLADMLDGIEKQIEEFAEILRIDVAPSSTCQAIADGLRKTLIQAGTSV